MDLFYNKPEAEIKSDLTPTIEVDTLKCPQGCVCQYAHLMDLPISRWINHMQQRYLNSNNNVDNTEDLINNNESSFENDLSYTMNPFIKQATCIMQEDTNAENLINALPHDMQALVLLYTGIGRNKTGKYIL